MKIYIRLALVAYQQRVIEYEKKNNSNFAKLIMKFSNYCIKFVLISSIFFIIIGCGPPPTLEQQQQQRATQEEIMDVARRLKELQDLGLIKLY